MLRSIVLALALAFGDASALAQQNTCANFDIVCARQQSQRRQANIELAQQQLEMQQAQERRDQELYDQQMEQLRASTQSQAAAAKPLPANWSMVTAYRTGSRDLEAMTIYLNAAADAFEHANAALEHDKQRPLYCQPPVLTLNADNFRAMIDKTLKDTADRSGEAQTPVGSVLLNAMRQTFPCQPQADQRPKRRERH